MDRNPYKNICVELGESYYGYDDFIPDWAPFPNIEIDRLIGTGKYSNVYLGQDSENDQKVVIKLLKPVREGKKGREIKILSLLKSGPHIVTLLGCMHHPEERYQSLVPPHLVFLIFRFSIL